LLESREQGLVHRHSFVGANPRSVRSFHASDRVGPLEYARAWLAKYGRPAIDGLPPFTGGLVGFIGWDAVHRFEPSVPRTSPDELGFPEATFMDFDTIVAFDHLAKRAWILARAGDDALARTDAVRRALDVPAPDRASHAKTDFTPRMTRSAFEGIVRRAKDHLERGDAQQIVLSMRFDSPSNARPAAVYEALSRINPSPYQLLVQDGERALVGTSPETLVRVRGGEVTVRPIAGTRKRGATTAEDSELEAELLANEKENAEHVMLVDLGRNDVGRVAKVGSVRVERFRTIERYSHVMHLVSEVRGQLDPTKDALDALRAAFPAGTVSGSPKVKAMQIIDALEPCGRGPYAGCVAALDPSGDLDSCITIRTLFFSPGRVSAQAGAGIVFDSSPSAEHDEVVHKARAAITAVNS
jgi:anthranilate synthase component 1